jgi:Flp pilus assembly protein TadG
MRRRKIASMQRLLAAFARKQDGAAAVEFALVGLPFFWLVFVIFETAAVLFTDIALQNGVAETARLIRTGQVQTQGISGAQFKTLLCGNIASYVDCSKVHVYVSTSPDLPVPSPDMMAADDKTPEGFSPGGPMEWAVVQVRYDWKLFVPGISLLANKDGTYRRLVAGALLRNEPYGG